MRTKCIALIALISFFLTTNYSNSYSQANCNGCTNCVTTANGLYQILTGGNVPPVVDICGPINLGDLPPSVFPLVVPKNVTLQGDFSFYSGTTLNFPYLYYGSLNCGNQFTNDAEDFATGDNYGYDDDYTNPTQNNSSPPASIMAASLSPDAFVFKLLEGAQLHNLCIAGPKTDTKETEMTYKIKANATCPERPEIGILSPIYGMSSGVLMQGKNSQIQNCEIFGFPKYGVQVRPTDENDRGNVYMDRCYIHNNKGWGYGYGVWLSGGGANLTCDDNANAPCKIWKKVSGVWTLVPTPLQNSPFQDHVLNASNCFFFENGKDFDASGDRNSVIFEHCTFSERTPAGANLNRHEEADVCNDYILPYSGANTAPCPNLTDCANDPHPNTSQACNCTIKEAGGNRTWIWNSFFYKGQNNMTLTYPNTFDPTTIPPPGMCLNPYISGAPPTYVTPIGFNTATAPLIHIGRDPSGPSPGDNYWNYFINPRTNKLGRIFIANTDATYWDINDPHIETNLNWPSPNCDGLNFYVPDEQNAPVPMLDIFTIHQPTTTINPIAIKKGDIVDFYTVNCRDAAFNMNTDMLYQWRFHEMRYDHLDEIRTASLGTNGLAHTFNNIGITNVNLMAIDLDNDFAASTIATKQLTIMPPANNGHIVMVVNLKDTYDGRHLVDVQGCLIDRVDDCATGPCNPVDRTPTNFYKFIAINGVTIWQEDISKGGAGWERVEMNIENFTCTDDPTGCTAPQNTDEIEIGLKTDAKGVDATQVRGISLYVDDVYIQSTNGLNALANGDFEQLISGSITQPVAWAYGGATERYTYTCNSTLIAQPVSSPIGQKVTRDEVRSGHYSYTGRVRSVVNTDSYPYYAGIRYEGGYTYKSVKQTFNVNVAPPPRLSDTTVVVNPGFTLQPNPAKFNTAINGFVTNLRPNETYNIKITAPNGAVVYNNTAKGYEFQFNAQFPPGVYFVNVQSKSYNGFKKLVVVK